MVSSWPPYTFICEKNNLKYLIALFLALPILSFAQNPADFGIEDDDLRIGGDIFNDFNEDLESTQVMEDERFYRYGRFFSFQIGAGLTSFDGNRGDAYENDPPTFGLGFNYFLDFQSSYGIGFEISKHHIFLDEPVNFGAPDPIGLVDVTMLRVFFSYRYYLDTSNLGTAITYSNPYFTGRMEYWYTTNKFRDQKALDNDNGGGLGFGVGFGLEFPVKIRESYINVEFLFHSVNFHDKYTQNYRPVPTNPSGFGFDDLTGNVWTTMVAYVFSW